MIKSAMVDCAVLKPLMAAPWVQTLRFRWRLTPLTKPFENYSGTTTNCQLWVTLVTVDIDWCPAWWFLRLPWRW